MVSSLPSIRSAQPYGSSAVYVKGTFLKGLGDILCDPSGKGMGTLIFDTLAPAISEKENSNGCAVFTLGPPVLGVTGMLVTSSEAIKSVMKTNQDNINNHDGAGNLGKFLGKNTIFLMKTDDQKWKNARTRHAPFFSDKKQLNLNIPQIYKIINEKMQAIDQTGTIPDLEKFSAHFTMEVMAKINLGMTVFPDETKDTLHKIMNDVACELGNQTGTFQKAMVPFLNYFPLNHIFAADTVDRYFNPKLHKLIDEGDHFLREKILLPNEESIRTTKKNWIVGDDKIIPDAMKDFLLSKEARDRAVHALTAGTETTTHLIFHGVATLGLPESKEIVKKLREEIASIKNGDISQWELKDFEEARYLNAFIDELLRLYPPVPVMLAIGKSKYDTPFKIEDMTLKGGEYIFLSPAVTHRLKSIWGKDADVFRPERFFEEKCPKKNPFAYFPFGWQPRVCVGKDFAKLEAMMIFINFINQYDLKLQETLKHPLPYNVIFTAQTALKGLKMTCEKRTLCSEVTLKLTEEREKSSSMRL